MPPAPYNLNGIGVVSALLAAAGFFVVYRVMLGRTAKRRRLFTLLALVAAIPGASFALYYAHLFGDFAWYYEFRSIPGSEFMMVFLGVAAGLLATFLPRMIRMLPLLGVVAFSVAPLLKPVVGPIRAESFKDRWDNGVCLQSTSSTCGAAATATLLGQLGVKVTEAEVAAEAYSYSGGTEAWYLARVARRNGLVAEFDFQPGFSPGRGLPALVGVELGSFGHFIAVLGRENDRFIVGDPLRGRELLSRDELDQRYKFTGFHLRLSSGG